MPKLSKRLIFVFIIVTISIIAALSVQTVISVTAKQVNLTQQSLFQEAMAHFQNMVDTRLWNASFNGVYVDEKDSHLHPNPYLKDNQRIFSENNTTMIRINPAWMTRMISEISNENNRYYYKITSLNPLNPHNKPDAFEEKALRYLEKHPNERFYTEFSGHKFNFMGTLLTEKACLECHAGQGYREGDIRGGLRVSIPTDIYEQKIDIIQQEKGNFIILVVLIALIIALLSIIIINNIYARQEIVEKLNLKLESKVQLRTQELQRLYDNAAYIKNVCEITNQTNEPLLNATNIVELSQDISNILRKHPFYKSIWIGFFDESTMSIDIKFMSYIHQVPKHFSLSEAETHPLLKGMKNAVQTKRSSIQTIDNSSDFVVISIPFHYTKARAGYTQWAVLCIVSDIINDARNEELIILQNLAANIGLTLGSMMQKRDITFMQREKTRNYEETIFAFVDMIEKRDTYTAGHSMRVAMYSKMIAKQLGFSEERTQRLEQAAILHDIGKIGTPDAILLKPSRLTPLEYELIQQHAFIGAHMLSKINMYHDLATIIQYHHARYDGTGYPQTVSPESIPLESHILIVADAFDAMTTNRIYKAKKSLQEALDELKRCRGTQFHPKIVDAALAALSHLIVEDTHQLPTNQLDQKRFAYFFQDSLTGLYNEAYLKVVLKTFPSLTRLYCVQLLHFSDYNKMQGWDQGNAMLQKIAEQIEILMPDHLIFRYHGDDFIILSKGDIPTQMLLESLQHFLQETDLEVRISPHLVEEMFPSNDL